MLLLFAIELCVAIVHLGCIVRGDTHSSSVELIPLTNGLAYIEIRSSSRERAILQRRRADHNYLPRSWMTLEKWLTASTVVKPSLFVYHQILVSCVFVKVDRLTVSLNNGDWNPRWVSNQTHPHIHESPRNSGAMNYE